MQKRPKIGIIISTTRPGRFADVPTNWLFNIAKERDDANFEIVDLRDYPMPFFEEKMALAYAPTQNEAALRWQKKIASLDGYIFVTAEYNHSIPAVLKNALDYLYSGIHRKPATFVGYGGTGAARAVEHLRHPRRGTSGFAQAHRPYRHGRDDRHAAREQIHGGLSLP